MSTAATETSPPEYVPPGENTAPEGNPQIPDDFKWSDIVAECDIEIRHRFMQRVYLLLSAQSFATVACAAGLIMHPSWQEWAFNNSWTMIVSGLGSFAFMIGAMIMRRKYPWNLVFLSLFTSAESWMVGVVTTMVDTKVVVNAFLITVVIFVALAAFAMQTKYDLTGWQPYLTMILFGLIGLGFVNMFTHSTSLESLYSYISVVLFSVFILVDIQMIMNRMHPEDEVPATIESYLDIINLFINLLRISSNNNDN